jgi:putative membrane protein
MELKYKSFKEVFINFFVGIFIGLSVIVPGISGSTMAITMKVYDKGMYAFSHIFKEFKKCFLYALPVIFGIFIGFFTSVIGVRVLLEHFPFITICAFLGLMIGTYPVIFKEIKGVVVTKKRAALSVVGFVVPILFSVLSLLPANSFLAPEKPQIWHYVLFFVLGLLISITQLMPGLSATVLMMVFGCYGYLIGNLRGSVLIKDFKLLLVYVVMGIGFLVGVFTFSKGIEKILKKARVQFFYAIAGVSIGSVVSVFVGSECVEVYKTWEFPELFIELLCGMVLLLCFFVLSFLFTKFTSKNQEK